MGGISEMDAQALLKGLWAGTTTYQELPEIGKETVLIYAHFRAESILELPTSASMAAAIDAEPEGVRDVVRKECRRLYNRRVL